MGPKEKHIRSLHEEMLELARQLMRYALDVSEAEYAKKQMLTMLKNVTRKVEELP